MNIIVSLHVRCFNSGFWNELIQKLMGFIYKLHTQTCVLVQLPPDKEDDWSENEDEVRVKECSDAFYKLYAHNTEEVGRLEHNGTDVANTNGIFQECFPSIFSLVFVFHLALAVWF